MPDHDPHHRASSPAASDFAIVGLGASAGGLQAVIKFLEHLPADNGMAFVVVMHLSPSHASNAASILQRSTRMPVVEVNEDMRVEPGRVHVIAPNIGLSMAEGMLVTTPFPREPGPPTAIDAFFRAMSDAHRERCFAVVLSGTGGDGASGMAYAREQGGVTLAQHPDDAEYDGMPLAAIEAGAVDFVLPVIDIPQKLIELWENARRIRLPHLSDSEVVEAASAAAEQAASAEETLRDIVGVLRARTGHDFQHYKRATMLRRLERRLQVRAVPDLGTYLEVIKSAPDESDALLKDLLIGVTQFFRDRDAFEAVERDVIPAMFENRSASDPVRLWVAACSTGEEAYSLGMLLCDQAGLANNPPEIQIFATDIDDGSIASARAGVYSEGISSDMAPARLRRYFAKDGARYRIEKSLREKALFAAHNLLRDPPFSKLDMVSCRNLLIYLNRDVQVKILEMFHFALKPNGILFLGSSESADALSDHFVPIDKKNRIYRAKPIPASFRIAPSVSVPVFVPPLVRHAERETERRKSSYANLHDRALAQVAPPSLIVNRNADILHVSENAGKYLRHAAGEPSRNLITLIIPELRLDLRTAMFQAEQSAGNARTPPISIARDGKLWEVEISAKHFRDPATSEDFTVVMFEEREASVEPSPLLPAPGHGDAIILGLEQKLYRTKIQLQETIEQAETSGEELKASNEELQAINEELRSASEELETGKEELQSVNEELITLNNEMKNKIEETSKANDDLQNLIASTDIATLFVDRDMRVMRYTPRAADIFNIIPGDIGRSLSHITHKLEFADLAREAARTFETLRLIEREVRGTEGKRYLARMLPYRTVSDRIEGALLTFIDVTELRSAEESLRESSARMRLVAASTMDYAIITQDADGLITSFNMGAEKLYGYKESELLGKFGDVLYAPEERARGIPAEDLRRARELGRAEDERWHVRKDGGRFFCSGVTTPLFDGHFYGYAKIGRDLTGRIEAESLRDAELGSEQKRRIEAQAANAMKDEFLAIMSHELKHPLNLIHINAELLQRVPEVAGNPMANKAARSILTSVASQARIIDDLLDFSRLNTGKLALSLADVDLLSELAAAMPMFRTDAAAADLSVELEGAEAPIIARADAARVTQVMANLFSNAVKFSRSGGTIKIRMSADDLHARIDMIDDGQGIAPQFLSNIFGMFEQSQLSTTRSSSGLGIGLALVKQIVELHGGSVEAHSDGLGMGARFTVLLPLARPPMVMATSGAGMVAGMRILMVDDSEDVVETFKLLLESEGASVETALSGREALSLIRETSFDVVISDVGMPHMDGYTFIREARTIPGRAAIRAIAYTGFGRPQDENLASQSGFDAYLRKPAGMGDIVKAIRSLLR